MKQTEHTERTIQALSNFEMEFIFLEFQDLAEVETEHRKGSSFYATGQLEIDEEIIKEISEIETEELDGVDFSSLVGTVIIASGYWDDDNGSDWCSFSHWKKVTTIIPERIVTIPESIQVTLEEVK